MKQIWRVARREIQSYYDHPTAYLLLVAFLLLAIYVAFRTLYGSGMASLRATFVLLPWIFAVFVPAMTMRAFAEERRAGTLEWLAAQPMTELELLLGKYLGNLLFALTTLVGTLPTAVGVLLVSDADPGIVVAQYAGGVLLAAQMTAIGIWASSASRNQITAFILGLAVSWGLVFAGETVVLDSLPPVAATFLANASILTHFENVARGVLDLRDALYFLSTGALFGAIAYFNVARLRLSPVRGAYRRVAIGVATIAVGVIVLNTVGSRFRGRLDLTSGRLYTLADETVEVLRGLEGPVTIKLFASRSLPIELRRTLRDVRDVLGDLRAAAGGKVLVDEVQPDAGTDAEQEALAHGMRPRQFSVLRGDELQVKRGWFGIAVVSGDRRTTLPILQQTDDLEYRLAAGIVSLTSAKRPRVAFLTGFGARSPFSYNTWREVLDARFSLSSIHADSGASPVLNRDSIDALIVAGPRRTIDPMVAAEIERYLDAGGAALLLLDGTDVGVTQVAQTLETGLEPLLAERGVRLGADLVFDLKSNERTLLGGEDGLPYQAPFPLWPRVLPAQRSPITSGLGALTLGWASPIEFTDTTVIRPLWTTTRVAGRYQAAGRPVAPDQPFRPDTSRLGREVVAVAVTPRVSDGAPAGRLVVVGDADFLEDRFARPNVQNLIFATNALDWLVQDERLIGIRSKDRGAPPLVFESNLKRDLLQWGNLAGVPLLVVLLGAGRAWKRRRRGG